MSAVYGTQPVLWTPSQISNLISWYDAADLSTITEEGGLVSLLADKSGNKYGATSAGGAKPQTGTRTLNGKNVLDFDGADNFLANGSVIFPSSGDIAVFSVNIIDSVATGSDSIISTDGAFFDFEFRANNASQFDGEVYGATLTGGPFPGPSIYNANFDFTGLGINNAFIDGTQRATNVTYSTKLDTTQVLYVMANTNITQFLEGAVAEVILTEDVTLGTRQRVEGYLAWKWGLVANLPGGHPYKIIRPTV